MPLEQAAQAYDKVLSGNARFRMVRSHRSCSKLIRRAMDLLPPRYTCVTAFSDATVGENGTIL
jgi:hypothetical protein